MNKNLLKSIGAIFAGMLVVVVLSTSTDLILMKMGIFPPLEAGPYVSWMLAFALAYRCIYTISGGYLTAVLAPDKPMRHVIILGLIGLAASITGVIVGWNLSAHWYPIALAITSLPCTWLGGKLKVR